MHYSHLCKPIDSTVRNKEEKTSHLLPFFNGFAAVGDIEKGEKGIESGAFIP